MSLQLLSIKNGGGNPKNECIRLRTTTDINNLSDFMLTDATYDVDDNVSNKHRHLFRFPAYKIPTGFTIEVYTSSGKMYYNEREKILRLYWGMGTCIWNNNSDTAHLFKVNLIEKKDIKPEK